MARSWASMRPMKRSLRAGHAAALLAFPALAGCATTYVPRPSPRVQVLAEGGSVVVVKNGRTHSLSMFSGGLEDVVAGNPEAEAEARSFHTKTVTGFVLSTLGAVSAGVGSGFLVENELAANPSTSVRAASLTAAIGGLVVSIVGSAIGGSAQPHLWNAINIYNDGLPTAYAPWPVQPAYPGYPGYGAPGYGAPGYGAPGYGAAPLPSTAIPLAPPGGPAPAPPPSPAPAPPSPR